jgi:hypothetical protein
MSMPKRVILPVLFCLISILIIDTAHAVVTFGTSSVPYETLETEHFLVRYEPGDDLAALDVSEALEGSYERITKDLGLALSSKTIVELYTTPRLYNQYRKPTKWAIGGKVYADMNMMVFPSPSTWGEANNHRYEDLWHVMPHEFTHVILRRYSIPMWLDEGVAVYESGQWGRGYQRLLTEAMERDELLSLGELEDFSTFLENGALSYAESSSAVAYIKGTYGDEGFRKLLGGVASGLSFEEALRAATGRGMREFEEDWMRYLEDALKQEVQEEASLKTAEVVKDEAVEIPLTREAVGSDDLPSPWLLAASFAALLPFALFVLILKALVRRATKPSI